MKKNVKVKNEEKCKGKKWKNVKVKKINNVEVKNKEKCGGKK